MRNILLLALILLTSCSSTSLVTNWKNPEHVIFHANKVLIVGMTQDESSREQFETKLQKEFTKRKVASFRSIDLFDIAFTSSEKSEEELSDIEQQLLDKDFDAILFTKITGSENRTTLRKRISDVDHFINTFRDDYLEYQPIYYDKDYYEEFTIYQAETSLYCICVDKERELIWRGNIDVMDPRNIERSIRDYIKLVVFALEEQDILFYELEESNDANL
ncbi:MAG: hypothetical protein AAF717_05355 [Bacteroidota bacterium]